jgi:hypothetical protein
MSQKSVRKNEKLLLYIASSIHGNNPHIGIENGKEALPRAFKMIFVSI